MSSVLDYFLGSRWRWIRRRGVKIGKDVKIGSFVTIGILPAGCDEDGILTVIGDDSIIRSHTSIYAGCKIGRGFHSGNGARIREFTEIGDCVSIGTNTVIEHHVKIGNGVRIHSQAFIPEYTVLEDGAWIGPGVVFTNAKYPNYPGVKDNLKGPIVKEGAKVGANVTVLPSVTIGKNAVIGAGSVVVQDVEDGAVVVGNPAKRIKWSDEIGYK